MIRHPVIKSLVRHLVVAVVGAVFLAAFWASRPQWDPEMRLWKSFGDAALMLLAASVALGPASRLWGPARRLLTWRRYTGIWFAVLATVHAVLVLDGWARWSLERFLGYEFVPQLERTVRLEPGFGLSNLLGSVALFWALVLLATSFDRAAGLLGGRAWKAIHMHSNVIFYLVVLHSGYFLFLHYTESFHKAVPEPDWFRLPFLALAGTVFALQWMAIGKLVIAGQRRAPAERDADPEVAWPSHRAPGKRRRQ